MTQVAEVQALGAPVQRLWSDSVSLTLEGFAISQDQGRKLLENALELGAAGVILVHNHPTGDVTPSKADIEMTRQVVEAAKPLGIGVHDHLVIGAKEHFSFKSHGLL